MRALHDCFTALLIGLMAFGLGCGGTINTGTARKPVNNKPAADGTCPSERNLCGTGVFAICVDLQDDPEHCGACDRACTPGIACQAGVCQQTLCAGGAIPFSGQPTTSATDATSIFAMRDQMLVDVNGDGALDRVDWLALHVADPNNPDTAFRVSLGLAGGGFAAPDTYHAAAVVQEIFATDVNDDGFDDLYVISSPFAGTAYGTFHTELWLGQSDGHLKRSAAAGGRGVSIEGVTSEIAVTDLSGDGWPDLIMFAPGSDSGVLDVYLSDSTGALHVSGSYPSGWVSRSFIRDWDGNGSPDLMVLTGAGTDSLLIFYNRGDGTFGQGVHCGIAMATGAWDQALVEDFNRDGRMDLALSHSSNRVTVMLGLGGCGFEPDRNYEMPGAATSLQRAADVNGDGQLDLITLTQVAAPDPTDPRGLATVTKDNLLNVLLGKPDGTFRLQDTVVSLGPDMISGISVGEVSGDGRPDLVIANAGGQIQTWENTCQ